MVSKILVSITVSKEKDELLYKLDCSTDLTKLELEYYLERIVEGICKWKPSVCEESIKSLKGTIQKRQTKKDNLSVT